MTDAAGRVGLVQTKSSKFETPALLPVIHPVRQLVPCSEIKSMGYEAVMTNAYTTFRRLRQRASEGIHKIIGFEGTVMTDSGGYQVLEFGSVEAGPLEMASFEEKIGSDIAIVLDTPTGLDVTKKFASETVKRTLRSAQETISHTIRDDILWTIPIQGGKYLDLVAKSSRASAKLPFHLFALGSPVEVMENYDFALLARMLLQCKLNIPPNRPLHLFGAGHPLIIPLAAAMGCDMFDSASYILFARHDRYISPGGTIRLEKLQHLPCLCKVCSNLKAEELRKMQREERTALLARHNLYALRQVIEETKQAIWEERLWEYAKSKCSNHPAMAEAFRVAFSRGSSNHRLVDIGTPQFKDRGIFVFDEVDIARPEIRRHSERLEEASQCFKDRKHLIIAHDTRTKPFLTSELFKEILDLVDPRTSLICYPSPIFGLIPAEISDIFPVSQNTEIVGIYPKKDYILAARKWQRIDALLRPKDPGAAWVESEIRRISGSKNRENARVSISRDYKTFKRRLKQSTTPDQVRCRLTPTC